MANPYFNNVNNRRRNYIDDAEYYPQKQFNNEPTQTQPIIQVSSEQQAKDYQIGVNNTVAMFEQSGEIFYIKQTDNAGFLSGFKRYKYIEEEPPKVEPVEYVTRQEFETTLNATMAELKELLKPKTTTKKKTEEVENG